MVKSLTDMKVEEAFGRAVAFFSKAPVYHIQPLPALYEVPPDTTLLSDGVDRKPCYFAHGEASAPSPP